MRQKVRDDGRDEGKVQGPPYLIGLHVAQLHEPVVFVEDRFCLTDELQALLGSEHWFLVSIEDQKPDFIFHLLNLNAEARLGNITELGCFAKMREAVHGNNVLKLGNGWHVGGQDLLL